MLIKELKECYKTVNELIRIRKEIEDNTRELYENIIETLCNLYDQVWEKADEKVRHTLPIMNSRSMGKANLDELDEITRTIVTCEKSNNEDTRYKYAYVDRYESEGPITLINLDLLREHLEADGFTFQLEYDQESRNQKYDGIAVSMLYDQLKEFRNSKEK